MPSRALKTHFLRFSPTRALECLMSGKTEARAMQDATFKCNALVKGRNPISVGSVVDKNVERFGNWIGGSVLLRDDHLVFSTNAMNAAFQEDDSDVVVPYAEITSIELGRMMYVFKTVDLETTFGEIRFRCMGSSNNKLMEELQQRRSHVRTNSASIVDQLAALAEVPVSDSIAEIAAVLSGQQLRVGIAEPNEKADGTGDQEFEFLVGHDANGASWLYLYTSEEAMIQGGLTGSLSVTMPFEELFRIAQQQNFGGFIVDAGHNKDCLAAVPAEYFDAMAEALS